MLFRYFHISIVECSVYVLVFRTSNNFAVDDLVFWLSCLVGKIVVCMISMWDIYHNLICNQWFSQLAKFIDCKDWYLPYYLSFLTNYYLLRVLL